MSSDAFDDLAGNLATLREIVVDLVPQPVFDRIAAGEAPPESIPVEVELSEVIGPILMTVLSLGECVTALRERLDT